MLSRKSEKTVRTTPSRLIRVLGVWLCVIGVILVVAVVATARLYDPPWSVREVQGVVVSAGKTGSTAQVLQDAAARTDGRRTPGQRIQPTQGPARTRATASSYKSASAY